jgi:cytochrome c oxidase cbb3-type subunit 3
MSETPKIDEISGVETTGHEWDGISELNTPIPRWWLWTFIVSCIWGFGYMIVMPSVPYPTSEGWDYTKGTIGYSQRDVVSKEVAANEAALKVYRDQIAEKSFEEVLADPELSQVALAGGKSAFGDNCAPCYGSGGQGFTGFPNLGDDDWIWGGTLEEIVITVEHGIRWEEDYDTRLGDMPAFVTDEMISEAEAADVTEFVLSISGQPHDTTGAARGAPVFEDQCSACHGEAGTGEPLMGAPDLTDAIWLYGSARETVLETISKGQAGVMPAWTSRLSPGEIKEVAIYVHALGGGE